MNCIKDDAITIIRYKKGYYFYFSHGNLTTKKWWYKYTPLINKETLSTLEHINHWYKLILYQTLYCVGKVINEIWND